VKCLRVLVHLLNASGPFCFFAFPLQIGVRGFVLSGSCNDSGERGATLGDKQTVCLH
jgi:hypothetical protein